MNVLWGIAGMLGLLAIAFACSTNRRAIKPRTVASALGLQIAFGVVVLGGALARLLGTERAESVNAAANIFLGQTEAPLVIKPYLPGLTRSGLFAVMVGGLSTVAGSVLVGYALLGANLDYLIAASFMAAPGVLLMAKIMVPEGGTITSPVRGSGRDGSGTDGSGTDGSGTDGSGAVDPSEQGGPAAGPRRRPMPKRPGRATSSTRRRPAPRRA